jgi:hypothetical protein
MKKLLKLLLLPALCAFFLLQAQQVAAQSKDNDVLVMEFGYPTVTFGKKLGLYIYWPDKDMEFIPMEVSRSPELAIANKKMIYSKINELADLGWDLKIVDNSASPAESGLIQNSPTNVTYYFKRATPK